MRLLALIACLAALVSATATAGTRSGLRGKVTKGPITPVCRQDVPCDVPAAHITLVFRRNDHVIARVKTSGKGTYRLALQPGRYQVSTAKRIGTTFTPRTVVVPNGRFKHVDFSIDTGIR